jgi:hypothetical protein
MRKLKYGKEDLFDEAARKTRTFKQKLAYNQFFEMFDNKD